MLIRSGCILAPEQTSQIHLIRASGRGRSVPDPKARQNFQKVEFSEPGHPEGGANAFQNNPGDGWRAERK